MASRGTARQVGRVTPVRDSQCSRFNGARGPRKFLRGCQESNSLQALQDSDCSTTTNNNNNNNNNENHNNYHKNTIYYDIITLYMLLLCRVAPQQTPAVRVSFESSSQLCGPQMLCQNYKIISYHIVSSRRVACRV